MARPIKMGVVSKKDASRFEWIVSDYFSLKFFDQKLLRSPYFSWKSDSWCFGLLVGSNGIDSGSFYVELSVSNRKGTGLRRLWMRVGIVGRGCEEKATSEGETNEIGILKIKQWVEVEYMTQIVDDTEGRLVIFCEIDELEEEGRDYPCYEEVADWSSPAEEWIAPAMARSWGSVEDWSQRGQNRSPPAEEWIAPSIARSWGSVGDWSQRAQNRSPPTENADPPIFDWSEDSGVLDWSPDPELQGLSNTLPVDACSSKLKTKETNTKSPSEEQEKKQKSLDKLSQDLKQLLVSEEQSDVVLNVQGKRFKAHRGILAARCPVFQSMFNHDTKEKETGKVDIADCDPGTFPDFLSYLYTGGADTLDSGNVFGLYGTADKYCVQELKEECVGHMKGAVSVDTFCDVLALALKHGEQGLIETCTALFTEKMTEIIQTVKWQTFICENGTAANELFIKALLSKENKK